MDSQQALRTRTMPPHSPCKQKINKMMDDVHSGTPLKTGHHWDSRECPEE